MKQEELKISLGKIQPREELIQSTLAKVRDQKIRREQKYTGRNINFSVAYNKSLRLAGAVCAFAFVFFVGFTAGNSDKGDLARALNTDTVSNYGVRMTSYDAISAPEWITVRGQVSTLHFTELPEESMGAIASADVQISVGSIEERSDQFSRKTIRTELTATVLFYDTESLNLLSSSDTPELLFRLIPTGDDGWDIHDFRVAE